VLISSADVLLLVDTVDGLGAIAHEALLFDFILPESWHEA